MITASDSFSRHFIMYFSNLATIRIEFKRSIRKSHSKDLAAFFAKNGHSLKHLELYDLCNVGNFESVGTEITKTLPNLQGLALQLRLTQKSRYMLELPYLKSLGIRPSDIISTYSILQTLSARGIIEELTIIRSGYYENKAPLNFQKLQSVCLESSLESASILDCMTRSHMPCDNTDWL